MNVNTMLGTFSDKINFMVEDGIEYGVLVDFYKEENPKQPKKWLFEYFKEWVENQIDNCDITHEEGMQKLNSYLEIQ
jgi:hypothetical protein